MKAWVLHGRNEIRFEERVKPVPGAGEVLVAVKAAGICGSDIPRIYQTGAHVHPLVPGHEFSGIVEAVGPGADPVWLGRRVGIFPLIPCGECGPCRNGQYEMCRSYSYLGSRRDGGFGEYAAVPGTNLIELPDSVSFQEAAMLEPMAVAIHAMRRVLPGGSESGVAVDGGDHCGGEKSMLPDGDMGGTVAVWGLGTIGLLLAALLVERRRSAGESPDGIFVIGNKDFQRQKILELGLSDEAYCDSRVRDGRHWLMERTGGKGADAVFECVGRNETVCQAIDSAAPAGKVCLVGNPASDMTLEKEIYWKILRNQLSLSGTWNSSFTREPSDDWHYALERLVRKSIDIDRLISHRFALGELEKGFGIMRDKSEDYVKIMAVL